MHWMDIGFLEIVKLAKEFRYAISREDLTNLIKSLRKTSQGS